MDHPFKTKPFSHQLEVWEKSKDLSSFAVFWEQGTGKSKLTIDSFVAQYLAGTVDTLLVVAPSGVDRNWITDELPSHLPDELYAKMMAVNFKTKKSKTKWHQAELSQLVHHKGPAVLTISYDAFVTDAGKDIIWRLMKGRKLFYVLDEAHNIKTPSAKRTKSILASSKFAATRRILTGTPIAQGPFDVYSQVRFLEPNFWSRHGLYTFTAFKQHFGVWEKGYSSMGQFDVLKEYKNLDQLYEILASMSSRVLKEDVLDLPPKLYSKRYFEMSPEQERMYHQMTSEFMVELQDTEGHQCTYCAGKGILEQDAGAWGILEEPCPSCAGSGIETEIVDADLAIVRLLRLQQITCGYLPVGEDGEFREIDNKNRRLDSLVEWSEGTHNKAIIWARFSRDIDLLMDALGARAVRYDGQVDEDQRAWAKKEFQHGDAQWFVGNPAAGATGLTLTAATSMTYYNNNFKLIDRLQSEDRAHRIGQEHPVNYTDMVAVFADGRTTVDNNIVKALREKLEIASLITGDRLKEWL